METRFIHGDITPDEIARSLIAQFDQGNLQAQQIGHGEEVIVQIATRNQPTSGGQTAIAVSMNKIADGVSIQVGTQSWLGVAASLGKSALIAWRNPLGLLSRLDDIAQDIEYLQITDQIWKVIQNSAYQAKASFELSERLKRITCLYCDTANPVGESNCIACGAPLGTVQPSTCPHCGFVIKSSDKICPNCNQELDKRST